MPHPETDYNLTHFKESKEHKLFTDPRGIEPAIVYCPEKNDFTYADKVNTELGFHALCGHCCTMLMIA